MLSALCRLVAETAWLCLDDAGRSGRVVASGLNRLVLAERASPTR